MNKIEIDALRLYEGDTRIRDDATGEITSMESTDQFYRDRDAYRTLNALLCPGVSSEHSRIFMESHKLNTIFLERIEDTIQLFCSIFHLMCEFRDENNSSKIIARRVERQSALEQYHQGRTPSFLSASKGRYDDEFASKDKIILLEIHLSHSIPHLDLQEVLGEEYMYPEEKEILLPPFLNVTLKKINLTTTDCCRIQDMYDNPPQGKYRIDIIDFPDVTQNSSESISKEDLHKKIYQERNTAINAIEAMNNGEWKNDFSPYIDWKETLHFYLQQMLADMWYRR